MSLAAKLFRERLRIEVERKRTVKGRGPAHPFSVTSYMIRTKQYVIARGFWNGSENYRGVR
jgi:hypothetical protein